MIPRFNILCRSLGYQPATVEKQVLRGHFKPSSATTPGKARVWSRRDVYALAIFEILFGAGMPPEDACQLSYLAPTPRLQPHLLLVWRRPGRWDSGWTHDVVKLGDFEFGSWAASKKISWAIVINLDIEANRAEAAFDAASQIEVPSEEGARKSQTAAKRRPGPR